ncbi:ORF1 [Crustacea hepe-like virus 1]|nr:ORF1 [Crustacea hepe-like virus 1]
MITMDINPHQVNNVLTNDTGIKYLQQLQTQNLQNMNNDPLIVDQYLNDEQFTTLCSYIHPRPVIFSEKPRQAAPHPVANILNKMAYKNCQKFAEQYNRVIDIGGTPLRTPKDHHICTLINDTKTSSRYREAALIATAHHYDHHDFASLFTDQNMLCTSGAECCSYQANYAYAVNVYDIDINLIPQIFANHGLHLMDMWMFLPTSLADIDYVTEEDLYKLRYDGNNNKAIFTLNDSCDAYLHDVTNWRKYLTTVAISCGNFNINVEHKINYKSFHQIRFVRTEKLPIHNRMRIVPYSIMVNTVKVPNMVDYFKIRRAVSKPRYIRTNAGYIKRAVSYGCSMTDNHFKFNEFAAYCNSIKNSVVFKKGNKEEMVYNGIDPTTAEYDQLVISLYIICALMRYERTQLVGKAINFMKDNQVISGIFNFSITSTIKNHYIKIKHLLKKELTTVFPVTFGTRCNKCLGKGKIFSKTSMNNKTVIKEETCEHCDGEGEGTSFMPKDFVYELKIEAPTDKEYTDIIDQEVYGVFIKYANAAEFAKHVFKPKNDHKKTENNKSDETTKTHETTTQIVKTTPISPRCNMKHIHVPFAPGYCAAAAIAHFTPFNTNSLFWANDDEIAKVLDEKKISYLIHQDGILIRRHNHNSSTVVRLNLSQAHWTAVDCNCLINYHVGSYDKLPLDHERIYVNCANKHLSDGAGQAAIFRAMFPNYDAKIEKPLTTAFTYVQHNNYDLILAVAAHVKKRENLNNGETVDFNAIHKALDDIFKNTQTLVKSLNKPVMLPLIGCGAFNNPLCCFKTALARNNFPHTICFYDDNQLRAYENTRFCAHGGYYIHRHAENYSSQKPELVDWSTLTDKVEETHMRDKYKEICEIIKSETQQRIENLKITELSAAPGHFAAYAKSDRLNWESHYYTGQCYTKWGRMTVNTDEADRPTMAYTDFTAHINTLCNGEERKDDVYIYDHPINEDTLPAIFHLATNPTLNHPLVIFKLLGHPFHKAAALLNSIATFADDGTWYEQTGLGKHKIYTIDGTRETSSELYIALRYKTNPTKADYIDTPEAQVDVIDLVDDSNAYKMITNDAKQCKCKPYEPRMNAYYTIQHNYKPTSTGDKTMITLPVYDAPPGNRKTQDLLKNTCNKCCIIVSPYKIIAKDLKDQNANGMVVDNVKKQLQRYEKLGELLHVVIDEVFAVNPMDIIAIHKLLQDKKINLSGMGDYDQIHYVDYNNEDIETSLKRVADKPDITHRVPNAILKFIGKAAFPSGKLKTKNPNMGVLEHKKAEDFENIHAQNPNAEVAIVFTQKAKEDFNKLNIPVITAGSCGGITRQTVHLYLPDLVKIRTEQVRHLYTAVTRTSNKLVTYGDETYLNILNSPVERIIDEFVAPAAPVTFVENIDKDATDLSETTIRHFEAKHLENEPKPLLPAVEDILDKIFIPTNINDPNVLGYKSNVIPENEAGHKFKFSLEATRSKTLVLQGRRLASKQYQKYYHGKNHQQNMHTMLKRYGQADKRIGEITDAYVKGFEKFLKPGAYAYMRQHATTENFTRATYDYIRALQKKFPQDELVDMLLEAINSNDDEEVEGLYNQAKKQCRARVKRIVNQLVAQYAADKPSSKLTKIGGKIGLTTEELKNGDIEKLTQLEKEWYEPYQYLIKFHLKRQPKEIRTPGYDISDKAGQGISAWSKLINIVVSSCTRWYTLHIKDVIKDNVQIASGKSDRELAEFFAPLAPKLNAVAKTKLMADFSEFDCSQEEKGIVASVAVLRMMGCNQKILGYYLKLRSQWTLSSVSNDGPDNISMFLDGVWKQHSGQPFTLDGNTMFNMMAIGMCYDWTYLDAATFKGDDSALIGEGFKERIHDIRTYIEITGYKIKAFYVPILEYISNIVTPAGKFFPDVIRRVSRVVSKIYTTQTDWEEQKLSITDSLDVINTPEDLEQGCHVAARFYNYFGIKITPDEVRTLLMYLYHLKEKPDLEDIKVENFEFRAISVSKHDKNN